MERALPLGTGMVTFAMVMATNEDGKDGSGYGAFRGVGSRYGQGPKWQGKTTKR